MIDTYSNPFLITDGVLSLCVSSIYYPFYYSDTYSNSYFFCKKIYFVFLYRVFWSISLGAKLRASNAVSRWQNPYTPPYVCVVQLVEYLLAMQGVASSNLVTHSNNTIYNRGDMEYSTSQKGLITEEKVIL